MRFLRSAEFTLSVIKGLAGNDTMCSAMSLRGLKGRGNLNHLRKRDCFAALAMTTKIQ